MALQRAPRIGDIYWLDNCEPIRGEKAKTRPVVLLTSPEAEAAMGGIFAVACTSSSYQADTFTIELPSHPEGRVRSGLRKKTWAVPQWAVLVRRESLGNYAGYISGALLDKVVTAFQEHYRKRP
jgi:mRNA-degrading endonuclease toxin of MazEF toxin-antitoxin module